MPKYSFYNWQLGAGTLFLVCLSMMLAPSLLAQTASTGALTGTVTDPSGAVIPNATVTIKNVDTGQTRTTMTIADGTYRFTLLPPGNYQIKIEAAGFKPVTIPSATVTVTETAVLDHSLEVGAQAQTITVEGEVEAIQTASSALGTVVNTQTVVALPLNTRNYTNLLAMSAGVASNVQNATTIGKGATNMYVNGASTGQNAYLLDGMAINDWEGYGGTSEGSQFGSFAMPNPDAIAEFKIQTSTYDAGYGRNPGANVNVITKSGTNNLHGSGFEFFRNTALNANDWFLNRQGIPKPVLNSNEYGGAVGGPVKKDKLFFFVSYQEIDQKNGFSAFSDSTTILPPIPNGNRGTCGPVGWTTIASCDAAGQAFVQQLATNMSASKVLTPGSVGIQNPAACQGAGNCDAAGLFNINPIAINLLQLKSNGSYYIPSSGVTPGPGVSGYVPTNFVFPATFKDHQGIGNVDYVINNKNTFSGRYLFETDPTNGEFGVQNALEPLNVLPGVPISLTKTDQDAQAKLTSILSNNLVNELSIGYERDVTSNTRGGSFTNSGVGIQDLASPFTNGSLNDYLFGIAIGNGGATNGLFSMGVVGQYGDHTWNNRYVFADQVSWTHGKHTVRAGFEAEPDRLEMYTGGATGSPAFKSFADFLIGRAGCGAGLTQSPSIANPGGCNGTAASNMSGTGGTANGAATTNPRQYSLSSFIQDDFKANARFTLNVGLRWELDQFPTEAQGGVSNFLPSLATAGPAPFVTVPGGAGESLAGYVVTSNYTGIIPAGVNQSSVPYPALHGAPWDGFAPRLGFAWQPTSSNRLVLRGGAGYFYNLLSAGDTFSIFNLPPLHGSGVSGPLQSLYSPGALPPGLVSAGPGYFGFSPLWVDPSTVSANPAAACLKPPCSSNVSNASYLDPNNWTVPVTYEWNLNTQWEFLPSWVLEVGYVGSHGIHQVSPGAVSGPNADGTALANPYNVAQLAGVGAPCTSCGNATIAPILAAQGNTPSNAILRVPYLGVAATATTRQTNSNYKSNSLQVTLRKRLSKGLQVQAAYTWARAFEQAPQGINTYPYVIQTYSPEYGVRPQRLVVSYVWQLPLGHRRGFLGRVTDGWSWSGVVVIQDGSPQDIVDSTGGGIFGVTPGLAGTIGHAQLCPGMTAANIATSGSTEQRITNGLEGGDGWINSNAFCAPPTVGAVNGVGGGPGFGNMGTGNILGPGENNWDMSFAKLIKIRESQNLEFRAEFFNTFNHPQFSNINDTDAAGGGPGTGLGDITNSAVNPRVIQFGLKYLF